MENNKFYYQQLINKLKNINELSNKKIDLKKIEKAMVYAMYYHRHQKRNSGEPFISHIFAVAEIVASYYFSIELIIISILHDIIEDTIVTYEMLYNSFGSKIAHMVKELTRIDDKYQKITIFDLIRKIHKNEFNKELLMIKICDRIHNMQTINYKSEEKIKQTTIETINNFLTVSMYLEEKLIEKTISNLCHIKDNCHVNTFNENYLTNQENNSSLTFLV